MPLTSSGTGHSPLAPKPLRRAGDPDRLDRRGEGLTEFLLGDQQPRLPRGLAESERLLLPEVPRMLELPEDLRTLNRPF